MALCPRSGCYAPTPKEHALSRCANMILHDMCPPDNKYYLCMEEEDYSIEPDCTLCWDNYLWGIKTGAIEIPTKEGPAGIKIGGCK